MINIRIDLNIFVDLLVHVLLPLIEPVLALLIGPWNVNWIVVVLAHCVGVPIVLVSGFDSMGSISVVVLMLEGIDVEEDVRIEACVECWIIDAFFLILELDCAG